MGNQKETIVNFSALKECIRQLGELEKNITGRKISDKTVVSVGKTNEAIREVMTELNVAGETLTELVRKTKIVLTNVYKEYEEADQTGAQYFNMGEK